MKPIKLAFAAAALFCGQAMALDASSLKLQVYSVMLSTSAQCTSPITVFSSPSPFWESLLSIVLQFVYFLQPIVGVIFIWSCATTLKASRVEENAAGVSVTGFGQYYIWLAYLMIALCGTTPVLVGLLRVLYVLWYGFLMMFIVRYALLLWRCRDMLDERLNPGG